MKKKRAYLTNFGIMLAFGIGGIIFAFVAPVLIGNDPESTYTPMDGLALLAFFLTIIAAHFVGKYFENSEKLSEMAKKMGLTYKEFHDKFKDIL